MAELMKSGLDARAVKRIAKALDTVFPQFASSRFQQECNKGLAALELKARVHFLIHVIHQHIGHHRFSVQAKALQKIPPVWDGGQEADSMKSFAAWPLIDYVAVYGLDSPKIALDTLEKLTPLFSAEFAIRPFISHHYALTWPKLHEWASHPNEHVRRLASEGCRPRLPWAPQLPRFIEDPTPLFPLLEKLKNDSSLYVRRSVANNLNDISKDHAEQVLQHCAEWRHQASKNTLWIIKHACRSLIKAGHPSVFSLLGYTVKPNIQNLSLRLSSTRVTLGETLTFQVNIQAGTRPKTQKIVVDFVVYYQKANGQLTPKVFKLKEVSLCAGETISLTKTLSFKPLSTRKYYPGKHMIGIQINGVSSQQHVFTLAF